MTVRYPGTERVNDYGSMRKKQAEMIAASIRVYPVGARVVWTGIASRPAGTVIDSTPSGNILRIRFDEPRREFEGRSEVWVGKEALDHVDP